MRLEFRKDDQVFDTETGECAGFVIPQKNGRLSVHRALTNLDEGDQIGVVKSRDEALARLTHYYGQHPPKWKRTKETSFDRRTGYTWVPTFVKWSFYGVFTVRQNEEDLWVASRCTDMLLRNDVVATFPTAEFAKYVADLHRWDGFREFALNDGYSWEDRRLRAAA